ncbi:hypothetical protein BFW38_08050 [Terasakiispira papahanaumokuakeensis]|uniref:Uncharacterized protein n=1 Tax=Terasakiispira papahanaumokuakeensis TaxID=197479 RepID=A0A1E2V9K0_9GAMM|nr:hypothetical protein [Terasakiispira papahanaumokuakeensis]ODC03506.1 hypothetical protein BFW38_08050 [Terasakiispira papahanaumokuakeensis]
MAIKISPERGKINALLFKNENAGLPMTLFLSISIDLDELEFQNETEETCIQLDFIKIHFRSFSDLQDKEFEFPVNPEERYIDGSIYLDSQHIPVDVTKISFCSFDGNNIKAKIFGMVLFDHCGYKEPNQEFDLETTLRFENIFIPPDIISPNEQNLDMAKNKLSEFFNVNELSEPIIESNGFRDAIVFHKST